MLKPGLDCGLWTMDCGLWKKTGGGGGVDPSLSCVNRGGVDIDNLGTI